MNLSLVNFYTLHYLRSEDLSKSFSQSIVSIYIFFFTIFLNRFCAVKKCGVAPHRLYRDSLAWATITRFRGGHITMCVMFMFLYLPWIWLGEGFPKFITSLSLPDSVSSLIMIKDFFVLTVPQASLFTYSVFFIPSWLRSKIHPFIKELEKNKTLAQ